FVRSIRFSPDNSSLATASEDKLIRIWDIDERSIRIMFDGHQDDVYALDFSSDGRLIFSGSGDGTVRIWDMEDQSMRVLTTVDLAVMCVAISPDAALVAAGCVDAVVRIWSVAGGALLEELRGHQNSVHCLVFTADGNGIVSGSLDNTLKYWDLRGGKARKEGGEPSPCTTNLLGHKSYVLGAAVSSDLQWVVSGSKDSGVLFWDAGGMVQCMIHGHRNSVISVSLDPAGKLLATGSADKLVRICKSSQLMLLHLGALTLHD
ncbi:global repressor Tup1p, partial [Mycena polygramma]